MVDYIGVSDIRRLLDKVGVGTFLERLSRQLEEDYRRWGSFEKSARLASHSPVGVIELMPTSDGHLYSFKYVNGHPRNTDSGLLTVTAFGVLAEVSTGYPLLLSELTLSTALRTAAMSALAAKWLARSGVESMALVGNGAQSEFQAVAFSRLLGVRELRLYDTDAAATRKLRENLSNIEETADLSLRTAGSVAEACDGADIITTVTADKRRATVLAPSCITPGMHLNAVGGDCPGKTELHPDILRRADLRVVVEFEPQSRVEGEVQQMPPDFPVVEFADVVQGHAHGRTSPDQVTLFDSVGFALEDYSTLCLLHQLLREHGSMRRQIDLIPILDDPKDLWGGALRGRRHLKRVA